jgi:excisionase family DNA binding protein
MKEILMIEVSKQELMDMIHTAMNSVQSTYSITDASKYLGKCRKTIYNMMERGTLPFARTSLGKIYFTKDALDALKISHE